MTKSVVIVVLIAVLVFWAVGAYNRLVRLRANAVKAFAAVDEVLSVQPALIQAAVQMQMAPEAGMTVQAVEGSVRPSLLRDRLTAAGQQYARALASARARPLDAQLIALFRDAQNGLDGVWHLDAELPAELCPVDLPEGLQMRLARLTDQSLVPAAFFDESVRAYNAAIQQFPALVLARIWGYRPAACLQARGPGDIQTELRVDD